VSNRRTLYLLMAAAAAAGVLRLGVGSWFTKYEEGLRQHESSYRQLLQDVDYLRNRRSNAVVAESDDGYLTHFQKQARGQHMAPVTAPMNEKDNKTFISRAFTIGFEKEPPHFSRKQVSAFLFNTELLMPRLRTTRLVVAPAGDPTSRSRKGPEAGSERDDLWEVRNLVFTQLTPVAKRD
jgi:hypothetical protein